jgi:hypothetical protein
MELLTVSVQFSEVLRYFVSLRFSSVLSVASPFPQERESVSCS